MSMNTRPVRRADMKLWSDEFSFLCMLLWPFVESYWLAAVGFLPSANRSAMVRAIVRARARVKVR